MRKPPLKRFPNLYRGSKAKLSYNDVENLIINKHIIEEKYDGTLTIKKYGDLLLMLEDMKYTHSIYYCDLIARYYLVDVIDPSTNFRLNIKDREKISIETGYPMPKLLHMRSWKKLTYGINELIRQLVNDTIPPTKEDEETWPEGFVIKSEKNLGLGGKYSRLDLTGEKRYTRKRLNKIIGWKKYYGVI